MYLVSDNIEHISYIQHNENICINKKEKGTYLGSQITELFVQ
jgi:hypothetical protein